MPVVANGTPLSVRIARGRPYSRNSRSRTGRTPWPLVDEQAVTRDQEARVLIGDRQRIAVDAIPRAELAFEVRGPEVIRRGRRDRARRPDAREGGAAAVSSPAPGAPADRPRCSRPASPRSGCRGASQCSNFSGPQLGCWRRAPQIKCGDVVGDPMRAPMRRTAPVAEPGAAACVEPGEPFVAGLATDAVARRRARSSCTEPTCSVTNESFSLFHGCRLQPGHRSPHSRSPA